MENSDHVGLRLMAHLDCDDVVGVGIGSEGTAVVLHVYLKHALPDGVKVHTFEGLKVIYTVTGEIRPL